MLGEEVKGVDCAANSNGEGPEGMIRAATI